MTASSRPLDVYDIACLAGGPDRIIDTAIVALVQSGRVRVHRPGQLATVQLSRRHAVEAAVLDAVGPSGHRSIDTIRWRLATDDRVLDVARRLQCDGLLGHTHRLVPHLSGGRSSPAPTAEGRRVLRRLEAQPPTDDVAPGTDAMLVALHGPERLSDPVFRTDVFATTRTVTPFRRGSRSADPSEAAADAALAARRATQLIHDLADPVLFPSGGPTVSRVPFPRGRRPDDGRR